MCECVIVSKSHSGDSLKILKEKQFYCWVSKEIKNEVYIFHFAIEKVEILLLHESAEITVTNF